MNIIGEKLQKNKYTSKSFVDHWTGIRKRFRFNEEEIFPNIIYLIDEEAKRIAIEEGINKNLIVIKEKPTMKK